MGAGIVLLIAGAVILLNSERINAFNTLANEGLGRPLLQRLLSIADAELPEVGLRSIRAGGAAFMTIGAALTLAFLIGKPVTAGQRPCREHPEVREPCFTVRGRLSWWNGTPAARIWIVDTHRMLGISDGHALPGFQQMPEEVRERMSWDTELLGDYTFCPFTAEQPGVMQLGCIQAAENLRAEKRPQ